MKIQSPYSTEQWNDYARVFSAVTTPCQAQVYEAASEHLSGHVADFGCGTAKITPWLADNPRVTAYTGIDYAPHMVQRARQALRKLATEHFTVQQCRIEQATGPYDSGVSIQSYYSWPEPRSVLAHIHRQLRPGGIFVLASANSNLCLEKLIASARKTLIEHPDFEEFLRYNRQLAEATGARFPSLHVLIDEAADAGFVVEEAHQGFFFGGLNFLVLRR